MNNRLNIQDLAGLLSERTGKDKGEVERFLGELFLVVSEEVCADKAVKVKGLGIFKAISVEKRESVHVHTGERFLIPKHYKFSFLPDKDLREQVNKPFSIFETTEINEDVDFPDMEEPVEEKESAEDESVEEVMPDREIPVAEPQPEPQPQPEERADRKQATAVALMVAAFVALVVLVFCYLGRNNWIPEPAGKAVIAETKDDTETEETGAGETIPVADKALPPDSVGEKTPRTDSVSSVKPVPEPLGRVRIKHGDRLTVIALENYGNKLFWVYIYQHNKAVIDDPNNVPIGTVIEIPAPELYGIDAKSRASREKAAALQTEILTGNAG